MIERICRRPDRAKQIQDILKDFSCKESELQDKIRQTLESGDEGMLLSREFDSSEFYLTWVYEKLNQPEKERFQDATLTLLDKLVENPKTELKPEAADGLLLILHNVCKPDGNATKHAAGNLKKLIENQETLNIKHKLGYTNIVVTLHERAVQMLVGFRTKEPIGYWKALAKKHKGGHYEGLILGGIINSDLDSGLDWLVDHKNSRGIQEAFLRSLPYYYSERFGIKRCDEAIEKIIDKISPKFAKELKNEQMGIKKWLKSDEK